MDKIKVLLVEDEETLAMIIKDTLEGQSFIIHTAADGEEGLRLFFDLRERLGQTVVIVTHDENLAAMADRKITMSDGLILGCETVR
jgi:DNA-binding response OmpR family regulator